MVCVAIGIPPGSGGFTPPYGTAHVGGGPPAFIAASKSAYVLPCSSLMSCTWCRSFPLAFRWNMVSPAGMLSGPSNAKSRALKVTMLGVAAAAGAAAGAAAESVCAVSVLAQPASTNAEATRPSAALSVVRVISDKLLIELAIPPMTRRGHQCGKAPRNVNNLGLRLVGATLSLAHARPATGPAATPCAQGLS